MSGAFFQIALGEGEESWSIGQGLFTTKTEKQNAKKL